MNFKRFYCKVCTIDDKNFHLLYRNCPGNPSCLESIQEKIAEIIQSNGTARIGSVNIGKSTLVEPSKSVTIYETPDGDWKCKEDSKETGMIIYIIMKFNEQDKSVINDEETSRKPQKDISEDELKSYNDSKISNQDAFEDFCLRRLFDDVSHGKDSSEKQGFLIPLNFLDT